MSNDTQQKKDGRGKKTGSTDTVAISIETLLKYAKPETVIQVRRKWLDDFEKFFGVKFIQAETPAPQENIAVKLIEEDLTEQKVTEESLASVADSEPREHLELKEEEL